MRLAARKLVEWRDGARNCDIAEGMRQRMRRMHAYKWYENTHLPRRSRRRYARAKVAFQQVLEEDAVTDDDDAAVRQCAKHPLE